MPRRSLLRNPKATTIVLVVLTFLLATVAIVVAMALQRRTDVNPTNPRADACSSVCDEAKNQCDGAAECESNTWCQNDATCRANCQKQRSDCNTNSARCDTCRSQNGGTPAPTQNPAENKTCNTYNNFNGCTNGGYRVTRLVCTSCNGTNPGAGATCHEEYDTQCGIGNTPVPSPTGGAKACMGNLCPNNNYFCDPENPYRCVPKCDGTTNTCMCNEGIICRQGVHGSGKFSCTGAGNNTCTATDDAGWPTGPDGETFKCRIPISDLGKSCPRAEFRGCNPGPGQMCICNRAINGGEAFQIGGYQYYENFGTESLEKAKAAGCESSCTPEEAGQAKNSPTCNNPYRCPGTLVIPTPNQTATPTPGPTTQPIPTNVPTPTNLPTPTEPGGTGGVQKAALCQGITLSPAEPYAKGSQFKVQVFTRGSNGASYKYRVEIRGGDNTAGYAVSYNGQRNSVSGTVGDETPTAPGLNHVDLTKPASYTVKVYDDGGAQTLTGLNNCEKSFTINQQQTQTAQCVDLAIDGYGKNATIKPGEIYTLRMQVKNPSTNDGTLAVYNRDNPNGGSAAWMEEKQVANQSVMKNLVRSGSPTISSFNSLILNMNATPNPQYVWRVTYEQLVQADKNFNNALLRNIQLNGTANFASAPACVVTMQMAPRPPLCTGLTVTPSSNIKQGDTLAVKVNTSDTADVKFKLDSNFGYSSGDFGTSPNFSVPVPTNTSLSTINLTGTVTRDGVSSSENCIFNYAFQKNPDITKTIDATGSTPSGLTGTAPNYVVAQGNNVKYNINVKNNGQNLMENLIVVDRLTAFDPANNNAPVTPAIGDIKTATNLARTTGTQSTPQTVAPRVPSGNGPYAAGTKSVEWTKIDKLHPGEAYTGSLTVDVLAFSGNPTLRNTVCLYEDTNKNGQYDSGTDKELRCDSVDVYTQTPVFTVTKQALELGTNNPVNVVEAGTKFRYVLTLTNTGTNPLDLANVTVKDTFDSNFVSKFNFTNLNGGTRNGNVITWNGGTGQLAPGATKTFQLEVEVKSDFFTGNENCTEVVKNNVSATSTSPNHSTTEYEVSNTVLNKQCKEEFKVTKSANPTSVSPSGEVTYTSQISNVGDKSKPVVRIVDDYSDEFSYVANSTTFVGPNGQSVKIEPTISGGKLTWVFPQSDQITLNPGQQMTVTYKMKASANAGSYPNTICVEVPYAGCATAQVTVTVNPVPVTPIPTTALPESGVSAGSMMKYFGIVLVLGSISGYTYMSRNRKGLNFQTAGGGRATRKPESFNDKLNDVISKLKK